MSRAILSPLGSLGLSVGTVLNLGTQASGVSSSEVEALNSGFRCCEGVGVFAAPLAGSTSWDPLIGPDSVVFALSLDQTCVFQFPENMRKRSVGHSSVVRPARHDVNS